MKKSLIFFLFVFTFVIINRTKARVNTCVLNKPYNYLSTINFNDTFNKDNIMNVQKICTNKVCTYNLDDNPFYLIKRHIRNVLSSVYDKEVKETLSLKGIKIDKIYFIDCI